MASGGEIDEDEEEEDEEDEEVGEGSNGDSGAHSPLTGKASSSGGQMEMEMRGIVERSASQSRMRKLVHEEKVMVRQDTLESEDFAYLNSPEDAEPPAAKEPEQPQKLPEEAPPGAVPDSPVKRVGFKSSTKRSRYASSGGSSTAAESAATNRGKRRTKTLSQRSRSRRRRIGTESSEDDTTKLPLAAESHKLCVEGDEGAAAADDGKGEEGEVEVTPDSEVAAVAKVSYRRAHSESASVLPPQVAAATASVSLPLHESSSSSLTRLMSVDAAAAALATAAAAQSAHEESDTESSLKFGRVLSVRSRRRVAASSRDYTSITDELESLIELPFRAATDGPRVSPAQPPAVRMQAETLHDAEETDFNLMESLIERRLRRDSHNLQASLEELVTKSIRDEVSVIGADEEEKNDNENGDDDDDEAAQPPPASAVRGFRPSVADIFIEVPRNKRAVAATSATLSAPTQEGKVRVRLAEDDDQVEVEFIDEQPPPSSKCWGSLV